MVGNGGGLGGFMRRSTTNSTLSGASGKAKDKMDLPKLQTRATSTFPPPHKTQLPMRYQTQHYQNASSARSPALICKRSAWVVFILLLFFFTSLYFVSLARGVQFSGQVSNANRKRYGVIIDAGSSGSRIHIFQYKHGVIPAVDLIGLEQLSLKRTPGLSSFAGWSQIVPFFSIATVIFKCMNVIFILLVNACRFHCKVGLSVEILLGFL
jgi:hypothetical protein